MVSLLSITQQSNIFIPFFCFGNFINVCGLYSICCKYLAGWLRVSRECLKWGPFENKKRDWLTGVSNGSKVIQTVKTALLRFSSKSHKNKALTIQYR